MGRNSTDQWQVVGALAGGAIVVGAVLPWFQVTILGSTASNNGLAYMYGFGTLLGGLLVGAGFLVNDFTGGVRALAGGVSVLVAVAATLFVAVPLLVVDPSVTGMTDQQAMRFVSPGIGLYLTLLAGVAGAVAAWQRPAAGDRTQTVPGSAGGRNDRIS